MPQLVHGDRYFNYSRKAERAKAGGVGEKGGEGGNSKNDFVFIKIMCGVGSFRGNLMDQREFVNLMCKIENLNKEHENM